jgi:RecB family exonuclease
VLERAWRRIRDHATLHALDAEALGAVLDEAVEATLAHFAESHRDRLGPRLRALERRRLLGLARDWLALERERAPFAVELMEEPQPLEIGGISVRGRVDRIDRLADGARVLIDYKTGATRLSAWWGERPDEPQLPLYAASGGLPLAGVAFAQVRRQELTFRGVADDPARFPRAERFDKVRLPPGTAPYASWAAVVEHWRAALERLAAAFRAGDARVDPKRGDTCAWCDLPGLCRIAEVRGTLGAAAAADPDGAGEERGGEERSDA